MRKATSPSYWPSIPSSIFLFAVVFAPTGWLAVLFWQLRSFLGQMDVPTRESHTMAIVQPP